MKLIYRCVCVCVRICVCTYPRAPLLSAECDEGKHRTFRGTQTTKWLPVEVEVELRQVGDDAQTIRHLVGDQLLGVQECRDPQPGFCNSEGLQIRKKDSAHFFFFLKQTESITITTDSPVCYSDKYFFWRGSWNLWIEGRKIKRQIKWSIKHCCKTDKANLYW